LYEVVIL